MNNDVTVTMISGEIIKGRLVEDGPLYVYVETTIEYDDLAISIFGKEYCENNKTLINKLPRDEIKSIDGECMKPRFETAKGLVTISEYFITIGNNVYDICSEQLSYGEYETYDLQEIYRYIVSDPLTETTYDFVLYENHDWELRYAEEVLHEEVFYYSYKLTIRED